MFPSIEGLERIMPARLNRRVVRETGDMVFERGQARRVVVELEAGGKLLWLRLGGQRRRYPVTYAELYRWAVRLKVAADKRLKQLEREARRKERAGI